MFESAEAAFDAVALLVEGLVVLPLQLAIALGRNNGLGSPRFNVFHDGIRVVARVCENGFGLTLAQEINRLRAVVDLAAADAEVQRFAAFVGEQVNLARQTSSGTPQSLVRAPFLRPVAACWWARTMVESSIRYWFFLSPTKW